MQIEDNNLDDIFRNKTLAEGHEPAFEEDAWVLMEKKLNRRDRIIFFKKSSVVLLVLFLGFGVYFYNGTDTLEGNNIANKHTARDSANKNIANHTSASKNKSLVKKQLNLDSYKKQIDIVKTQKNVASKNLKNNLYKLQNNKTNNLVNTSSLKQKNQHKLNTQMAIINQVNTLNIIDSINTNSSFANISKAEMIAVVEKGLLASSNENDDLEIKPSLSAKPAGISNKKSSKLKLNNKPIKWGLAFSLGPENNTVNNFGSGETTLNGGILLKASINEKWSLSSGFVYGIKNYNANVDQYTFATKPRFQIDNIDASCNVLEIPIRASYQLSNTKKGSFYINSGLSSLLMLKEQYTYQYNPSTLQANRVIIKNDANQHILGVLELSTTYEFKLKGKSNLGINPYIKLPLTGIGEGEVNLKSTGINLNYNYDFTKKKK